MYYRSTVLYIRRYMIVLWNPSVLVHPGPLTKWMPVSHFIALADSAPSVPDERSTMLGRARLYSRARRARLFVPSSSLQMRNVI